jgi:2-hydroxy-6-oxonona-2,4-dienedioate hydrolase
MLFTTFKHLKVDGINIRFIDRPNKGKSVLLLHGLGGAIESWRHNINPLFKAGLRLIAMDLPGFGYSDKPRINYSIKFYTSIVGKFIKRFEFDTCRPLSIVGSSLGGQVAAETAIHYPDIVSKLVLISPAGGLPFSFKGTSTLNKYINDMSNISSIEKAKRVLSSINCHNDWNMKGAVGEDYARVVYERMTHRRAREAFLSALRGSSQAARLNKSRLLGIKAHTLVIWGKEDRFIPAVFSIPYIKVKNFRVLLLENCGHQPYVDKPCVFNNLVAAFIKE